MGFFLGPGVKEENKVLCLQKSHNLLKAKERWSYVHTEELENAYKNKQKKRKTKQKYNGIREVS